MSPTAEMLAGVAIIVIPFAYFYYKSGDWRLK